MTGKKMKKLRRAELLEMLIEQTKRGDALEQEIALLREQLQSRELSLREAGTLAEASIRINAVFEAADAAAAMYLENVRRLAAQEEKPECREDSADREEETE